MLPLQGNAGVGGEFQIIRMDASQVKGNGPDGKVEVWDLFEFEEVNGLKQLRRNKQGRFIPKDSGNVRQDVVFHNKFTKRGLARMMCEALRGHDTGNFGKFAPVEVASPTTDCFAAFVMYAMQTSPSRSGDQRVEWNESDTTNVAGLPAGNSTSGEGRRGVLLSDTAGILRRLTISYIGTSPYGVLEYVFFADPNSPAVPTGDKGLDSFPIRAVALAASVAAGDGEAGAQVGIRAVVGLAPTIQGVADRGYVHEGQQGGLDVANNDLSASTTAGTGYVQSSALADVQIGITSVAAGGDSITSSTRTIVIAGAATALPATSGFNAAAHVRKVLRIAGAANSGNNGDYTIQEVVNATTVKVFVKTGMVNETGPTFTGGVYTVFQGHNLFDGNVKKEGLTEATDTISAYPVPSDAAGQVVLGEQWSSADNAGPHTVGRVFAANQTISGVRLIVPIGVNKDFVPNSFKFQGLNPAANGGNPRPNTDGDWIDLTTVQSNQGTTLFDAGVYGVEYTFTPTSVRGVRMKDATAFSSARSVKLGEFMMFTSPSLVNLSSHTLKLKVKSGDAFKTFNLPNVSSPTSVQSYVDALNQVLRGYQMEAVRSTFGFLWLRSTVAGNNSQLFMDTEGGSDANTELFGVSTAQTRTGITQAITKASTDALTLIYRLKITGDVPGGAA